MDEITNNQFNTNSWDTTATTTDNIVTYNLQTDGTGEWFPYYTESTWLPYKEVKYIPKWHTTQGYKNQIKTMWD